MAQTAETFLQSERDRFKKRREELQADRAKTDLEIAEIDRELYALDLYVQAKQGKLPTAPKARKAATSGPSGKRGELGGFRKEVYDYVLQLYPKGRETKDVQTHFNPRSEKKRGTAVSAALFNLKKQGHLTQAGDREPYIAVSPKEQPAETAPTEEAPALAEQEAE